MHVFLEWASAITQAKYCPKQDPRQSVTSSYHLNQSALWEEERAPLMKKGIFLCECSSFTKNFEANMPACRCVVQQQVKSGSGIYLRTSKSSCELAKWKSSVRTHRSNFNPKGPFEICSVHFSSNRFERTVHIEGAPTRLIATSIPTIWKPSVEGPGWANKPLTYPNLSETVRGISEILSSSRRVINNNLTQ